MVPFGAPFVDNNNNGIYEQGIDIPGVKNAKQTIFVHLSDADPSIIQPEKVLVEGHNHYMLMFNLLPGQLPG